MDEQKLARQGQDANKHIAQARERAETLYDQILSQIDLKQKRRSKLLSL